MQLKIIRVDLLEKYKSWFDKSTIKIFENLRDSELSVDNFSFYTSVSAVFSSKIEGELIELDSFIKHKRFGTKYLPDYTKKTDDLYDAYLFAQRTKLSKSSLEKTHTLITRHILQKSQQGRLRKENMFVVTDDGRIEYVAVTPDKVEAEMKRLYEDIKSLLLAQLSFEEVFFFASMLHLSFVKIHPFQDGNGRMSRLLEKWFVAQKLGGKTWLIQSEKNYYVRHQTYYHNIRLLGLDYEELDYSKALPFCKCFQGHLLYRKKYMYR